MCHLRLLIYVIGIFSSGLSAWAQETSSEFSGNPGMVIVEPTNVIAAENEGEYKLVPYLERRNKWGYTASVGYSSYMPVNYEPDFLVVNFDEIYETAEMPLIELKFAVKRNSSFGSLGGELSVGFYENRSDLPSNIIESTLRMFPVRLGLILSLDAFSPEPRFVPYMSGGLFSVLYREFDQTRSLEGNTQVAPFMNAGMAFQLDWIDKVAARTAYEDSGIQASYLYTEVSKYFASSAERDKDFESDINWGAGLRVEF